MLHLILGGARSGKSSFAERYLFDQLNASNASAIYIATAQALDDEMAKRIAHHQQQRNTQQWRLLECPLELKAALLTIADNEYVLIDCLTLWLSNQLMHAQKLEQSGETADIGSYLAQQVDALLDVLKSHAANIVIVSNEIGLGVVPMGKETRLFVDHQGWLNQKLAGIANQVTLVTAGLPLTLKAVE